MMDMLGGSLGAAFAYQAAALHGLRAGSLPPDPVTPWSATFPPRVRLSAHELRLPAGAALPIAEHEHGVEVAGRPPNGRTAPVAPPLGDVGPARIRTADFAVLSAGKRTELLCALSRALALGTTRQAVRGWSFRAPAIEQVALRRAEAGLPPAVVRRELRTALRANPDESPAHIRQHSLRGAQLLGRRSGSARECWRCKSLASRASIFLIASLWRQTSGSGPFPRLPARRAPVPSRPLWPGLESRLLAREPSRASGPSRSTRRRFGLVPVLTAALVFRTPGRGLKERAAGKDPPRRWYSFAVESAGEGASYGTRRTG